MAPDAIRSPASKDNCHPHREETEDSDSAREGKEGQRSEHRPSVEVSRPLREVNVERLSREHWGGGCESLCFQYRASFVDPMLRRAKFGNGNLERYTKEDLERGRLFLYIVLAPVRVRKLVSLPINMFRLADAPSLNGKRLFRSKAISGASQRTVTVRLALMRMWNLDALRRVPTASCGIEDAGESETTQMGIRAILPRCLWTPIKQRAVQSTVHARIDGVWKSEAMWGAQKWSRAKEGRSLSCLDRVNGMSIRRKGWREEKRCGRRDSRKIPN
ncbi:hypothetical protein C8R45DRAFT_1067759 [Mycena sanguinolenta]|nr:hypothetical protein C8R45DRAFT_1067759 [Mycena sanguinolenta]